MSALFLLDSSQDCLIDALRVRLSRRRGSASPCGRLIPLDLTLNVNTLLEGAKLSNANLRAADLEEANLLHADRRHADLGSVGPRLVVHKGNIQVRHGLGKANMKGANTKGATMKGAKIEVAPEHAKSAAALDRASAATASVGRRGRPK